MQDVSECSILVVCVSSRTSDHSVSLLVTALWPLLSKPLLAMILLTCVA